MLYPKAQTEDTLDCALLEGELASQLLAALREQDLPELAAEIAPDWDCLLYTSPRYKGDKALCRAIEVLESVREEGQDKAEWNMRMAYGYQYLYGQEEKASLLKLTRLWV